MKEPKKDNAYQTYAYTVRAPKKAKESPKSTVSRGKDMRSGGKK